MKEIASSSLEIISADSVSLFYQSILIYLTKAQVVNRKISFSKNVASFRLSTNKSEIIFAKLEEVVCSSREDVELVLESLGVQFEETDIDFLKEMNESTEELFLSLDLMTARNSQKFDSCLQATLINPLDNSASFRSLNVSNKLLPPITYKLSFSPADKHLRLSVDQDCSEDATSLIKFVLIKKIQSWMETFGDDGNQTVGGTHELIDSDLYNKTYLKLKEKYGRSLEANWNESTDPKKFIYEDIAIAAYLIALWKKEDSNELQSFADLGCGNGLLVYILTQEGHRGYGIDLRKRRIWDQFPPETDLREEAIVPSDKTLFADVDWIIGNHSDELSPWIPVITARSSFTSKFFLLPCCAFEFSGAKYQKKGNKSQYLSFIDYLMTISDVCGFENTKLDRLKIPSTKRICLVGSIRSYDENEFSSRCEKIQSFINESTRGTSDKWSNDFKPRDKIEISRNCTKIERSLLDAITMKIFNHLLAIEEKFCSQFPEWNCGGEIQILEAVKLVSSEDLKKLKVECGGIQTLLRNQYQTFQVVNGIVRIRIPVKHSDRKFSEKAQRRNVIKTSPCFFYQHHPSSCPLGNDDCSFIHSAE